MEARLPCFVSAFLVLVVAPVSPASQSARARVERHLLDLARREPDVQVTLVLDLERGNLALRDEIRSAVAPIDETLAEIAQDSRTRARMVREALGYPERKEELIRRMRDGDEDLAEEIRALEQLFGLSEPERRELADLSDELRAQRAQIVARILRGEYAPLQRIVLSELAAVAPIEVLSQDLVTNKVTLRASAGLVPRLASVPGVREIVSGEWNDQDELNVSMAALGAPQFHSNGISGAASDLLFINSNGVFVDHDSLDHVNWFSNCFVNPPCGAENPTSGHDTIVAGVVASDHLTYRGVAYGMDKFYNGRTSNFPQAQSAVTWALVDAPDSAEVITMSKSWGGGLPTDCGDRVQELYVDEIVDLFRVDWVKSAGNQGQDGLTLPGRTYNIVAVGAMDDHNTLSRGDDFIALYSSRGPVGVCNSTETRIKPDLVAPGDQITSTAIDGGFESWSGTSFAAPHVSGSLLLLLELWGSSSGLERRALLLNSAEDRLESSGAPGSDGPDNTYGHGYVDLVRAWFEQGDAFEVSLPADGTGRLFRTVAPSAGEKVTATWNRHIVGGAGLVNDVEMTVYDEATGAILAQTTHVARNIEQIAFTSDYPSTITSLRIKTANVVGPEEVGVAFSGHASLLASNNTLAVTVSAPAHECVGLIPVTASVQNTSGLGAFDVTAELGLPPGFSVVAGGNPQDLGDVPVGQSALANWTVQVGPESGLLSVEGRSYSFGETLTGLGHHQTQTLPGAHSYCSTNPHSAGGTAQIGWSGSTSVGDESFRLLVVEAVPSTLGIFYYGAAQTQLPFGEGVRCVDAGGAGIYRLPVVTTDSSGDASYDLDWSTVPVGSGPGEITGGGEWNFQFWFRDPAGGPAGFNLSDALQVVFCN